MARSAENSLAGALAGTTAGVENWAKASQAEATSTASMSRRGPTFMSNEEAVAHLAVSRQAQLDCLCCLSI